MKWKVRLALFEFVVEANTHFVVEDFSVFAWEYYYVEYRSLPQNIWNVPAPNEFWLYWPLKFQNLYKSNMEMKKVRNEDRGFVGDGQ